MKCSSCSAEIRPVVAIDIDGTLADYHEHFIEFLESYLGGHRVMRQYGGGTPFKSWVMANYQIDARTWADIKLAYRQGAQKRSMLAFPYAAEMTARVADDAEVWLTTTRPYLRMDNIDPDTRFWLARHRITFDHLLYDEDKYGQLADRVDRGRVVAVLDDLHEQYDRAESIYGNKVPILNKTIWNREVNRPHAVHGLDYALIQIENRLRNWRERHA